MSKAVFRRLLNLFRAPVLSDAAPAPRRSRLLPATLDEQRDDYAAAAR